jgi:ATP-dependent DNA helicase RecG
MFDLATPVEKLYLIGPARAKLLQNLGVKTLRDLLFYFPRYHQDLSKFSPIAELKPGEFATIKAKVVSVKTFRTRARRLTITQAVLEDDSGATACNWFNQPYMSKNLKVNEYFIFSGKVQLSKNKPQLQNPVYEPVRQEQIHTARMVPIYPLTANLTQKQLRSVIKNYLDRIILPEYLPSEILREEKLMDENRAVKTFHFPADHGQRNLAQKRLAFDEIFQTQIRILQYKAERRINAAFPVKRTAEFEKKLGQLPFELTGSQSQALDDILHDFSQTYPANRLLEGDVGSGKTIIAALSMWLAAKNGFQSALLAPTEVLAGQHFISLMKLFINDGIDIALLTSSNSRVNGNPVSRATILAQIQSGKIKIVLGTHALLEPNVKFAKLAAVIIDEQHRFGVKQRSLLQRVNHAHLVSMTATPIPRTLALTLYGDLDISRLTELPKGRLPIKTILVSEDARKQTYQFIAEQIKEGRQAFVVCPLIEESDKLGVKSVTAEHEKLNKEIFPDLKVGLLHGKLKPQDKEKVMQQFKDNEIQILVSTSVIEVGVDVPNATVMIIEGAERFGLAQLHQFRGRVGRSSHQSYCFLFSDDQNAAINPRLHAIVSNASGFNLAEKDLEIRGSGDLYGTAQSGYGFKVATLSNLPLVERSKKYAERIVESDPKLKKHNLLREIIQSQPIIHLE